MMTDLKEIVYKAGKTADPETGLLAVCEGVSISPEPVYLTAGAALSPKDPGLEYRLFYYSPEVDPDLIHKYTYQPESVWATYIREKSDDDWRKGESKTDEEGYYRIAVKGAEPSDLSEVFDIRQELPEPDRSWMDGQLDDAEKRAKAHIHGKESVFFLLTDTHYSAGCIWPDTEYSLVKMADRIKPDAVIHLGDITDGLTPLDITKRFASRVIGGLKRLGAPLYICLGNHDANYFKGNTDVMTTAECAAFYMDRSKPYFSVDMEEHKLKLFFLDSFAPFRKERYGFSTGEMIWFVKELLGTPKGWRILVFSHVTPQASIHVWSESILNGEMMLRLFGKLGMRGGRKALGWICGHNHSDQMIKSHGIPIISVGCAKLEDFPEFKAYGSTTFARTEKTGDQELWDILIVDDETDNVEFVRFGAGRDRVIENGEGRWADDENA